MAVFSTNQVRQLYVVKAQSEELKNVGDIYPATTKDETHMYFKYKGAGGLTRTDLINIDNILWCKYIHADADSQITALKQAVVKLDTDVNEGKPISGQDYILRITINPYVGMSDEEPYIKYGAVHATKKMNADPSKFYVELAASLYRNFSREIGKMFDFVINDKVVGGARIDENGETFLVEEDGTKIDATGANNVTIVEAEQDWTLGIKEQTFVNFKVTPTTVTYDGEEVTWGEVELSDSDKTFNNSRKIADLEYFCLGERGDQYRSVGWPNAIPTTYLANSESENGYNILEIHYAYVGANEGVQKSEKDIVLVSEGTALATIYADIKKKCPNKCEEITKTTTV